MKQPNNGKITALYERLSKDDEQKSDRVSIANQKQILEDYAQKNGFPNTRHFTDDGVRGTTFKRPGLDAMLDEIRAGNVATVIIKDQSRIGCDVVEVGLLKRTFPYGYLAGTEDTKEWRIDEEAAAVVRRIFQSVIDGKSIHEIGRVLRTEQIPIPSAHWERIGAPVRAAKYADPYAGSATTIGDILKRSGKEQSRLAAHAGRTGTLQSFLRTAAGLC
jgi:DNA invertase Pin-like site-specific DNA recombinase